MTMQCWPLTENRQTRSCRCAVQVARSYVHKMVQLDLLCCVLHCVEVGVVIYLYIVHIVQNNLKKL